MKEIETRPSIADWTKNEFMDHLNEHMFDYEEAGEAIFYSLKGNKNALLWGAGGYAKSLGVETALRMVTPDFYSDVFITTAGPGMDSSQFVGYIDIKELREQGTQTLRMQDTMYLKNKYAIVEEILSAPYKVLLALRDPLQRGSICTQGTCFPNTLKSLFGCTNVSPTDWVEDMTPSELLSAKATLNRFHYQVEVKWNKTDQTAYEKFFAHQTGSTEPSLAEMIEYANNKNCHINPRWALQMLHVYRESGLTGLKNFNGLPKEIYAEWEKIEARRPYLTQLLQIEQKLLLLETSTDYPKAVLELTAVELAIRQIKIPQDAAYTERLSNAYHKALALRAEKASHISYTAAI